MWTKDEKNKLIEVYSNMLNIEIAELLGKTRLAINAMGVRLGLKKSPELIKKISKMGYSARIDKGGRDLSYENLKKIANKYKTRIDFIRDDNAAYNSARIKGVLDDICSHMTVIKFSIPQLILREITDNIIGVKSSYNNRKVIKPYEIDVYYDEFNLGFEFQGIAWHKNNKNDAIKSKLAIDKGINIIYIHEYNNSRDYENDIKKQLIENLIKINYLTNKNISKHDVLNFVVKNIYLELYNKDELIDVAKRYNCFIKFKNEKYNIYKKLLKMKLIDEATSHMDNKKISKHSFSDEFLISIINKYDNLTDFRKHDLVTYRHIKRLKKEYLIKDLKRKPTYELNDILLIISKYNSKTEFIKENPKLYKFIRRGELKYLLTKWDN